jgi:hypothetical protein
MADAEVRERLAKYKRFGSLVAQGVDVVEAATTYEWEHVPSGARCWLSTAGGNLEWDVPAAETKDEDIRIYKIFAGDRTFFSTLADLTGNGYKKAVA